MLNTLSSPSTLTPPHLMRQAAKLPDSLDAEAANMGDDLNKARELKEAFTQFVGETFFGQMLRTMRQSVGEPAYFHGGMAERQFQAQLDQNMAQEMAATSGGAFANGLFESQFPNEATLLAEAKTDDSKLASLDSLRRR